MSSAATDKAWETLGRVDPYWAVISNDAYHGRRLTDQQLAAFLKSGGGSRRRHLAEPAGVCLEMTSHLAASWILDAASDE